MQRSTQRDENPDPAEEIEAAASTEGPGKEPAREKNPMADPAPSAKPNEDKAAKAQEYYQQWVRAVADFDNFKKRAARERMETARYACSALLEKLLPVLDNLEMALSAAEKAQDQSVDSLRTGVSMVLQQFKSALKESGMEEIDAADQPFDPNLHEAVSQQETEEVPEGHIAVQLRRGYRLYDRLLRPASVVVAKAPSGGEPSDESGVSSA